MVEAQTTRCDVGAVVQAQVLQSVASSLHSVFREESTRHAAAVWRGKLSATACPTLCETAQHYLCFPHRNTADVTFDQNHPQQQQQKHVAVIGGNAFLAPFITSQCERRGVTVQTATPDSDGVWPEDTCNITDAVRGASLVFYLAPTRRRRDLDVFLSTLELCRRIDTQLVVCVPMADNMRWWHWYRAKLIRKQEQMILHCNGQPTANLCGDATRITPASPLRVTLCRLNGKVVYPSFHQRVMVARNNNVQDFMRMVHLPRGDLDAKLLANVLLRATALCRSTLESRVDIAGQLRRGVGLRQVDTLLHSLRSDDILEV